MEQGKPPAPTPLRGWRAGRAGKVGQARAGAELGGRMLSGWATALPGPLVATPLLYNVCSIRYEAQYSMGSLWALYNMRVNTVHSIQCLYSMSLQWAL